MNLRDLPNLITVLRMLLVVPLVWALTEGRFTTALTIALVAGLSDAVDGFLAKRFGWVSRVGGILDPIADKLLLMTCLILLAAQGLLPMWLALLAVLRDIVIVTGGVVYHYRIAPVEGEPILISKANTFLQITLVLCTLLDASVLPISANLKLTLIIAVAASTVLSGLQYVLVWGTRAYRHGREQTLASVEPAPGSNLGGEHQND